MSQNYNVTFNFKEVFKNIKGKQVRIAVTLIDNAGYLCGIYANYKDAKDAIPKIRRNILVDLKKRAKLGKLIPVEFLNT